MESRTNGVKALDSKSYSGGMFTGEAPRARSGALKAIAGGRAA